MDNVASSSRRDIEKPLEYWINRATDPFVDTSDRIKYMDVLCERVNSECDAAQVVTTYLAHKLISPDQEECYLSLQLVDQLVRRCGEKVHSRVGKFRFLNQIVKLVTPKYLAAQTSPEVKQLAIELLYTWQRSMRHVEKFKEVYESLKDHKIITKDPEIAEDKIIVVPPPPPKYADFEDEQKAKVLKELLSSGNPADLQAANRMIKNLVKHDEERMEKQHQRRRDMDKAITLCDELENLIVMRTTEAIGLGNGEINMKKNLQDIETMYDELMNMRPALFRHAGEAAESGDPLLNEILLINDKVNRWIQRYRVCQTDVAGSVRKSTGGTEDECTDLLSTTPIIQSLQSEVEEETPKKTSLNDLFDDATSTSSKTETLVDTSVQDVPFIGFDRILTPALPRRIKPPPSNGSGLSSLGSLMDADLFATPAASPPTFKPIKPTLNDLCLLQNNATFGNFTQAPIDKIESNRSQSISQNLILSPSLVSLSSHDPIYVLDKMNFKVVLYRSSTRLSENLRTFVVALMNLNVEPINNISIKIKTSTLNAELSLQEGEFNLPALSINSPVPTEYRVLCVLPLTDIEEIELDISIYFTLKHDRSITSFFNLPLN